MKRATIIKDDNVVGIDGVFFNIDCSTLPENFHAFQWYEDKGYGEEEWIGNPRPENTIIRSIEKYQSFIDAWYKIKEVYDLQNDETSTPNSSAT